MCPKGESFPRQLGMAIATTFPHLPRLLSQAKGSLALIPLVGSMARRTGVEYRPSFEFLMHKENLSLSTSVAHLKRFSLLLSTLTRVSLANITLRDMEHPSQDMKQTSNLQRTRARKLKCGKKVLKLNARK
jgi:hypothetical protein